MTRPWLIWSLWLLCAAGIFGAMGIITHRSLRVELEGAHARADAELQERIRLALWRMETEASALMIEENNRPPEHFHSHPADPTGKGTSPLAGVLTRHVRLHFDIGADGVVSSPQVPQPGDARFRTTEESLQLLRQLLARSPTVSWCSSVMSPAVATQGTSQENYFFLDAAAKNGGPFDQPPPPSAPQGLVLADRQQDDVAPRSVLGQEAMKQQSFNNAELSKRAEVYTKSAEGKGYLANVPAAPIPSVTTEATLSRSLSGKEEIPKVERRASVAAVASGGVAAPAMPAAAAAPAPVATEPQQSVALNTLGSSPTPAPFADAVAKDKADMDVGGAKIQQTRVVLQRVTPFRPFWLEQELFLVREVAESGHRHVQGVWLDAASLRASLLATISDILPRASLQPVATVAFIAAAAGTLMPTRASEAGDPMNLVGLPWRLLPGEATMAVVRGWTPMRLTLAAAWAGAGLAALAAAALLLGVTRLSERRAAFVSSVTHELRTPLTTFRLYSELLEQGMIPDEADRAQYLHTLRTEADRLTHLVDNVLAYSRIERTDRRARLEQMDLAPWFERVKGRIEDRTREAGMKLEVRLPADTASLSCVTDATALEQILFNLVDNACKYAAGRCEEPLVRVMLERRGRWVELRVCDSGPGIARSEQSRLFRPFHKSADEAANSKPGVGLGLALCHRLARALGGRLMLDKTEGSGACFVLRLPAA